MKFSCASCNFRYRRPGNRQRDFTRCLKHRRHCLDKIVNATLEEMGLRPIVSFGIDTGTMAAEVEKLRAMIANAFAISVDSLVASELNRSQATNLSLKNSLPLT
jgi:hypothetical protein